jgi:hypothetical protein
MGGNVPSHEDVLEFVWQQARLIQSARASQEGRMANV